MLGINTHGIPMWLTKRLCDLMISLGKGEKGVFIHPDFQPHMPYQIAPCNSHARHDHHLELQRGDEDYQISKASYFWTKEAIRACALALEEERLGLVSIPVLEFQAGHDAFVTPKEEEKFADKIAKGRLVVVPDSRHEIYRAQNSVLKRYLDIIFDFLSEAD
jgi:lysophospholipase